MSVIDDSRRHKVKRFCYEYSATVREGKKFREPVPSSILDNYNSFVDTEFLTKQLLVINEVPTVDITMAERDFDALLALEERIKEYKDLYEKCNLAIREQNVREARDAIVRANNPGVQKAFEHYNLLLKMALGE